MKLFQISDNSSFEKRWTWAWAIRPRLDTISVVCEVCGHGRLYPEKYPERPLNVEVEKGVQYPDILGCGSYPLFIVSEAVIIDWKEKDIAGYEDFPITVTQATGGAIKKLMPPQYHHLKITGNCELDIKAMGISIQEHCWKCNYTKAQPTAGFKFIIKHNSWDGSDLFISQLFPQIVFCSSRVFDLVDSRQRTNFRFEALNGS